MLIYTPDQEENTLLGSTFLKAILTLTRMKEHEENHGASYFKFIPHSSLL